MLLGSSGVEMKPNYADWTCIWAVLNLISFQFFGSQCCAVLCIWSISIGSYPSFVLWVASAQSVEHSIETKNHHLTCSRCFGRASRSAGGGLAAEKLKKSEREFPAFRPREFQNSKNSRYWIVFHSVLDFLRAPWPRGPETHFQTFDFGPEGPKKTSL